MLWPQKTHWSKCKKYRCNYVGKIILFIICFCLVFSQSRCLLKNSLRTLKRQISFAQRLFKMMHQFFSYKTPFFFFFFANKSDVLTWLVIYLCDCRDANLNMTIAIRTCRKILCQIIYDFSKLEMFLNYQLLILQVFV